MTKEKTKKILQTLDREYGVTKDGFLHTADWQLLVAIMLSAQSTDKQVDEILPGLWKRFPDLKAVIEAPEREVEDAIKSIGLYKVKARNMKKCCGKIWEEYEGKVPVKIEDLVKLPGVGRKTATLFLADAYGIPGVTVDTHVFRISRRPIVIRRVLTPGQEEHHRPESSAAKLYCLHLQEQECKKQEREKTKPRPY